MIERLIQNLKSLLTGMRITAGGAMSKPVTQRYPHVEPELPPAYRSAIKLIRFEETGSHDCVACLQCQVICPSACIAIDGEKIDGIKKQRASKFEMDFALCSLCGLCIDVCPTTTLEYSRIYDEASYSRNWTFDLLDPFRAGEPEFIEAQRAREAEAAAKKAAAKKAPAAEGEAPEKKAAADAPVKKVRAVEGKPAPDAGADDAQEKPRKAASGEVVS
jgi:NADH-quinone oxidoreductase subunit I